jgi:hypothetical protein
MTSSAQIIDLIERALARCDSALTRASPAEHEEIDRVRRELQSWRSSVMTRWPPEPHFLNQTRTLGVYAARELWDYDRQLAEAIIAVRQALKTA